MSNLPLKSRAFRDLCARYPELNRAHLKEVKLRKKRDEIRAEARRLSVDDPSYSATHTRRRQAVLDYEFQRGVVVGTKARLRLQERSSCGNST